MHRIFLICAMMLLIGCSSTAAPTPQVQLPANITGDGALVGKAEAGFVDVGQVAPDFSYTSANGKIRLSDLHGKVVIVNFWATWCGPCRQEMPDLQKIADTYQGQVVVLGINKLELADAIVPFSKEVGVHFQLIADPSGGIPERYGVRNLPTSFFIRPDGTIGEWKLGALTYDQIADQIKKLR